ncbi:unnamed protein product [Symbiodinium sp. CCMP2592]|nr:unnamed protein product [Symbiodinium sp. CCMP2592]
MFRRRPVPSSASEVRNARTNCGDSLAEGSESAPEVSVNVKPSWSRHGVAQTWSRKGALAQIVGNTQVNKPPTPHRYANRNAVHASRVCGVLPDRMQVQQREEIDPLDDELSGNGIEHRIDDAWAVMSEGCSDAMDLMQKKAQAMLRARLAEEVGDFDARVHRECVGLVAAHKQCVLNAAKEGLERSLPALDVVRACKQPSRWQAWSGANAEPGPNGPSERTSSSDWMSTTCPTERLGPSPAMTELRSPTPLGVSGPVQSATFTRGLLSRLKL